jgi:murein DD-endopeptidase MepM/ murein hydrolase activator NlpD
VKAILAAFAAAVLFIASPLILLLFGGMSVVAALAGCLPAAGTGGVFEPGDIPETTRIVMPLAPGTYSISDSYGWRTDPFTGERAFHHGSDFPAADGTPIMAIADGVVRIAGYLGGWGNLIVIEHTVAGQAVATAYAHMWDSGVFVAQGQTVAAGDVIGAVGSSGRSTGPHLHLEIQPGGWGHDSTDAMAWLIAHDAEGVEGAAVPAGCQSDDEEEGGDEEDEDGQEGEDDEPSREVVP